MKFVKMHGLGNDFVVVDGPLSLTADEVEAICDRRRGVGADGVLAVTPDPVRMDYWNADGSAAEMCGNGLRCVTRYAVDRGWADASGFVVTTAVGDLAVAMLDDRIARVEIGTATIGEAVDFDGFDFQRVDVGNPHAVTFVPDPGSAPVESVGAALENATPGGTNVEFASLGDMITMRTWERGCGETLACGTGAVAVATAARHRGAVGDRVPIRLLGGELIVEFEGDKAWITGPAEYSFAGEWAGRP